MDASDTTRACNKKQIHNGAYHRVRASNENMDQTTVLTRRSAAIRPMKAIQTQHSTRKSGKGALYLVDFGSPSQMTTPTSSYASLSSDGF